MNTAASAGARPVILITADDLAPQAVALLQDFEIVYAGKTPTEDDIVALCRQHDPVGIIVRYSKVGEAAMRAAPSLRVISKHGSGTDTIDKTAAAARGIEVRAAAGVNAGAVAEEALALLLACAKSVVALDARMRAGHWDKATHKSVELAGKTLGLVGLGAIGRRMARMAHGLGMRVIGFDPYATDAGDGVTLVDLEAIWRESDAISLHCPLTADNRGMVNARTLALCKPGVIIVNTARGGLIEETDLLQAVRSGQVGSAGLDSFAVEPMKAGHPFQQEPRILLSPHIGGVTPEAYIGMGVGAARNVLDVLASAHPA